MFGKKKNEDYSVKTVKVGVDKLTTIALGTMVKGTITVEGDLRLDGIIEGNVSCDVHRCCVTRDVTGRYSGGRRFDNEIGMYNEW